MPSASESCEVWATSPNTGRGGVAEGRSGLGESRVRRQGSSGSEVKGGPGIRRALVDRSGLVPSGQVN